MSLLTRLLRKDDTLPIIPPVQSSYYNWPTNLSASWTDVTPATLAAYYIQNPIAHACIRVYADAFAQARMKVYKPDTDEEIENHPTLELLRRPNNIMGQSEFWRYTATYALFGGNSYTHIVGNRGGRPGELWPYSAVQMVTVPSPQRWVDHYAYNLGMGQWKDIPPAEIIHVKWAVDVEKPWQGLAPMRSSARAIDTHNEFTRLRKVLLENDAIPRTALKRAPEAAMLTDVQKAGIRQDFRRLFAGDQAGTLAILEGGADLVRLALNMDEIQASELTAQLEADICASFGVHPIIAKVKLGLDKSTYSNYAEAVEDFTKSNLVPLWESVASEFTNGLQPFYGDGFELRFDTSKVQALQEDQNKKEDRARQSLAGGLRTLIETRRLIGEPDMPEKPKGKEIDYWFVPKTVDVVSDLEEIGKLAEDRASMNDKPATGTEENGNGNGATQAEPIADMPVIAAARNSTNGNGAAKKPAAGRVTK